MTIVWPLFVFVNDTTVELCKSLEDARREFEETDLSNGVYLFYDFYGRPVDISWLPNTRENLILKILAPTGGFEFSPESDPLRYPIDLALLKTDFLTPTSRFASLVEVYEHLESHNCDLTHSRRLHSGYDQH